MPRGLVAEEQPRDIVKIVEMTTEQVHKRSIYPRSFFAPNQPTPTPPASTLVIYPYNDGGFFPS